MSVNADHVDGGHDDGTGTALEFGLALGLGFLAGSALGILAGQFVLGVGVGFLVGVVLGTAVIVLR